MLVLSELHAKETRYLFDSLHCYDIAEFKELACKHSWVTELISETHHSQEKKFF